jgi:hypothetical protein
LPDQNSFLCLWSSWGEWGGCSSTCGSGVRERFRVFLVGQNGREGRSLDEDNCSGGSQETRDCTTTDCPGGVNIELNKTTLTIGLKGIERNSVFKEESIKQKKWT